MRGTAERGVLVVGGGRLGTALASILARLDRRVDLWVRRPEAALEINEEHKNERYLPGFELPPSLTATTDLGAAVRRARLLLMAVPSQAFREVARSIGDFLQGDQLVVHATKGFEEETFKRMSQLLREETCALKIGVLGGPTFAHELMSGQPAGALVASRFAEVSATLNALFEGGSLRVYTGSDVIGTEVAGAFRNVVALAVGISDGLGYGENAKSLLVTRGLNEMGQLGVAMGANVLTFGGLAGVGDLMAVCSSQRSVNLEVGRRLAKGEALQAILDSTATTPECIPTLRAVRRYADSMGLDLPIADALHGLLFEGASVREAVTAVLSTPVGPELAALRGG